VGLWQGPGDVQRGFFRSGKPINFEQRSADESLLSCGHRFSKAPYKFWPLLKKCVVTSYLLPRLSPFYLLGNGRRPSSKWWRPQRWRRKGQFVRPLASTEDENNPLQNKWAGILMTGVIFRFLLRVFFF